MAQTEPTSASYSSDRQESSANASSSSSPSSYVREEESSDRVDQQQLGDANADRRLFGLCGWNFFRFDDLSAIRDDTWSCVVVILTFWFFVSMTLILGVYGPIRMMMGPSSSVLIQSNSLFLQSMKVEELDSNNHLGLMLYGFHKTPPINIVKSWSKAYNVTVPANSHREWIYYLNKGSHINISYTVNVPGSSFILVIAQGNRGLSEWLEDPAYPNSTLSWNLINGAKGSGIIQQKIQRSSSYYVAVGNLNSEQVEVQLNIGLKAFLYNTTEARLKCAFTNGVCRLSIPFPHKKVFVLTSPCPDEEPSSGEWHVKLSYGPRWVTYIVGIGAMTLLMLAVFCCLNKLQCFHQYAELEPERAPLLLHKAHDLSSLGSSYGSVSNDEDDVESSLVSGSFEGKPLQDGKHGNNTLRLCAICFDAPRDCFFLPCGHFVACFGCATRIVETAGTCPICRRNMKKVRKIFTV